MPARDCLVMLEMELLSLRWEWDARILYPEAELGQYTTT